MAKLQDVVKRNKQLFAMINELRSVVNALSVKFKAHEIEFDNFTTRVDKIEDRLHKIETSDIFTPKKEVKDAIDRKGKKDKSIDEKAVQPAKGRESVLRQPKQGDNKRNPQRKK